jgi:hypothetical protein
MNYGNFFKLNNKKSDLSNGITCYDYIWLCDESNNDLSKFPIYVTISKDSIDFHAHYHNNDNHLNNTILSLPLSANIDIKDGLTGALVEGWKTNYPQYENDGNNYLYKKLEDVTLKNEMKGFFYADLLQFNKVSQGKNTDTLSIVEEAREKIKKENGKPYRFSKFIRKLILDFLFDLEHTKVFQTSSHYEYISVKLKENFFFSALAAKANFYYQRKIMMENQGNIDIEYYLKAEKEWTKCIRSLKAQTNFNSSKGKWFDDPEIEMDRVYGKYFKKMINSNKVKKYMKAPENKTRKEEIDNYRKKSSKWLTWHYKWNFDLGFGWHLWFPRLMASVLTVWVTIIIGSSNLFPVDCPPKSKGIVGQMYDLIKIEKQELWPLCISLVIIIPTIHAAIFYSIRQRSPSLWKGDIRKESWLFFARPFKAFLLSLVFSFFFGVILSINFGAHYYYPKLSFWSCVFLAMFIGVVLQQVTDEKYTEE